MESAVDRHVFYISDGTAITAEVLGHAVMSQFPVAISSVTLPFVENISRARAVKEQIDAIYSGDQKQINKAFCGPLALVGPEDGELYSIYWLADHNADDYLAAGLPLDKVRNIIEAAQTGTNQICHDLGKAAEATLAEAEAIEAAASKEAAE